MSWASAFGAAGSILGKKGGAPLAPNQASGRSGEAITTNNISVGGLNVPAYPDFSGSLSAGKIVGGGSAAYSSPMILGGAILLIALIFKSKK